jgi:hypothetical protein
MSQDTCVLCRVYRPKLEAHYPDRTQTCDYGRRRLERDRMDVLSMYRRLAEQDEELIGTRDTAEGFPKDPLAALMPMANTPGQSKRPSVSGSKERQLPINVEVVDLLRDANSRKPSTDEDQVGSLSVATVLHGWANYWRLALEHSVTPLPMRVPELMKWIGYRLTRFTEEDPEIGRFAEVLIGLKGQLRGALGEQTPKPEVMWGVPCRRCDTVSTLVLDPDDPDRYRECSNEECGLLMTEDEYKAWLVEIVETMRRDRLATGGRM